jgi:hypothetical protein
VLPLDDNRQFPNVSTSMMRCTCRARNFSSLKDDISSYRWLNQYIAPLDYIVAAS